MKHTLLRAGLILLLVFSLLCSAACDLTFYFDFLNFEEDGTTTTVNYEDLADVPAFTDKAYVSVHGGTPYFTESEYTTTSFETYGALDSLGRCTVAYACVGKDLMPTESRGDIGSVHPTGWQSTQYDIVDGKYLYNRCHLIGFQLTGENANKENLITGTRYLNIKGMLSFENMVADYVKETNNHVLYRVTPIFDGNNLVASGVLMEGWSVEDNGDGICFCVYAYNSQPGIDINYADGTSCLAGETPSSADEQTKTYVLNTGTHKFHNPTCSSAKSTSEKNKEERVCTRQSLLDEGYTPCSLCTP